MRRSRLWREFESGDTVPLRLLRLAILLGGTLVLGWMALLFLDWEQQAVVAGLTLFAAFAASRWSKSYGVTLTLVLLSVYSTARYGFWRITTVMAYGNDPGVRWTRLDAVFVWMLLLAECYAFVVLLLGYIQTVWPLRRRPVPLPTDPEDWPAVDLLIPTLDEPLSVVRYTALAAMNIDWPAEKLNVYILDDGRREEFRKFAEEAGIGYMSREDHRNAKAGNINSAMKSLNSPLVVIFDCDHVPTRSFLQLTVGWFLRDPELGVLQTPQHFYSPNPFERNLDQFGVVPNEDELFYGVVQDGNDFWNATCFCGSCAVLRRSALDEVGGLAVETVTEDTHTSLRMQMRGWNTAYINIPQAAGLASERLSGHLRQRIRWARGMVQILRLENPLFAPGLKAAQRLCYFNGMAHFLYALPRLIFLTAPCLYLILGIQTLPGLWLTIVAYALPHLVLTHLTLSRIQGKHRHSFWNEIYETVLAPYLLLPTLFALIRPRAARYNVTAKGGVVQQGYFDARIARPFFVLAAINLLGLLCAIARLFRFPAMHDSRWMRVANWPAGLYDRAHAGVIAVNVLWTLFNLMILGVAIAVAWESQQRRRTVRVARAVPSDVILADSSIIQGMTSDLSSGGVRTRAEHAVKAKAGDRIRFVFPVLDGSATLPATVIGVDGNELRARFDPLSLQEDEALTMILYSRADAWLRAGELQETDRPARSLARILRLSLRGLTRGLGRSGKEDVRESPLAGSAIPMIALALVGCALGLSAQEPHRANGTLNASSAGLGQSAPAAEFHRVLTLDDLGVSGAIALRGMDAIHTIDFDVSRTEMVKAATLKLRYHFSPGLIPGMSHLNVSLNGSLIATIAVDPVAGLDGQNGALEATINLPFDLLVHENKLLFEFIGHYAVQCEDASNSTLWARIDGDSSVELAGSTRPLVNDLKMLPYPFYDPGAGLQGSQPAAVPIVFLSPPSTKAMQAAGVIASWMGVLHSSHAVRFPVSIRTIPAGNAIVIAEDRSKLPAALGLSLNAGATLSMVSNPVDSNAILLVIAGDSGDDLMAAAGALALHAGSWQGSQVSVAAFTPPAPRAPDDAPRWLSTDTGGGSGAERVDLGGDGSAPVSMYLRLPPDLSFGQRQNLGLHLSYRYNGVPLGEDSTLQVYVNGTFVSGTPMPHTDHASSVLDTVIPIPVVDLHPFLNTITFQFAFRRATNRGCSSQPPANLEGTILKDTYLDISGISHAAVLPDLQLFANAGYPFTRSADLAETSVVLPDQPSRSELELYLALMGHFGAQTGSPALRVTVTDPAGMTPEGGRDYLVLGTEKDQPGLDLLDGSLPVEVSGGGLSIHDSRSVADLTAWWRRHVWRGAEPGKLETRSGQPDALLEGTEWPAGSRRSVVAVVLRDDAAVPAFIASFLVKSQSGDIAQSVSVLRGDEFSSYRIGGGKYRVGQISPMEYASAIFQDAPWLIGVVTVVFCFLMAGLIQTVLRRHARDRLHGVHE